MITLAVMVGLSIVSYAINYFFFSDDPKEDKAGKDKKQPNIPVVDDSNPVPVIYGNVTITGGNVVWARKENHKIRTYMAPHKGKMDSDLLGRVGAHLVFCQKATHFFTLEVKDVPVYGKGFTPASFNFGPLTYTGHPDYRGSTLVKYPMTDVKQYVFQYQVLPGESDQTVPELFEPGAADYYLGGDVLWNAYGEAYRGVVSIVIGAPASVEMPLWEGMVADVYEEFPPIKATFSHTDELPLGPFNQANPSWIIRDMLTNEEVGAKIPIDKIDIPSFNVAYTTLTAEDFGLNFFFQGHEQIEARISEVLRHIDGVLYQDHSTGKIVLKLIREGETPKLTLDATSVRSVDLLTRPDPTRLPTRQVVTYTRKTYNGMTCDSFSEFAGVQDTEDLGWAEATAVAEAHDSAGAFTRGDISAEPKSFPGIISPALAFNVAQRELRIASAPRTSLELTLNPLTTRLYPGDTFKFTWPEYGMTEVIYRVLTVNYGVLTDSGVTVTAVEDIFQFDDNIIQEEPPDVLPPVPVQLPYNPLLVELPYWLRTSDIRSYDNINPVSFYPAGTWPPDPPLTPVDFDQGGILAHFQPAKPDSRFFDLDVDGIDYFSGRTYLPSYVKTTATAQGTVNNGWKITFAVTEPEIKEHFRQGAIFVMYDPNESPMYREQTHEFMLFDRYVENTGVLTLHRGMLDTPPMAFPANSILMYVGQVDNVSQRWLSGPDYSDPALMYLPSSTVVNTKTIPSNTRDFMADPVNVIAETYVVGNRSISPLPPAGFRMLRYTTGSIRFSLSWYTRMRTLSPKLQSLAVDEVPKVFRNFRVVFTPTDSAGTPQASGVVRNTGENEYNLTVTELASFWPGVTYTHIRADVYTLSYYGEEVGAGYVQPAGTLSYYRNSLRALK